MTSRTGESRSSADRSRSRSRSASRSRSGRRAVGYGGRHNEPSSPNSFSLDEYTQKSTGTTMDGGEFSGMRAGMKNQLIRVADHRQSGYASRYGVNIEKEERNDSTYSKRG